MSRPSNPSEPPHYTYYAILKLESLKNTGGYVLASDHIIVRMWHGRVPRDKAEAYRDFLVRRAVPDYESVKGNLGVEILMRENDGVVDFLVLSYWESMEAVKNFAGEDYEKAKYYDEDKNFLLEFEPNVQHYHLTWSSRKFKAESSK